MRTADFDYDLPPEQIAQTPAEPRDSSRLLVLDRRTGTLVHTLFGDIGRFLVPGDLLVINDTRVIPARLHARKLPGGGQVELLLLERKGPELWLAMAGGKGMLAGRKFEIIGESEGQVVITGTVLEVLERSLRLVRFNKPLSTGLGKVGEMPLPPYIHEKLLDPERYQTVYARDAGSAAAPTAGLHFTSELLASLEERGISSARVTLHVGLDTFAPVHEDNPEAHAIHSEWCRLPEAAAAAINRTKAAGGRVVCVGTTSVRTVETATRRATSGEVVSPFEGPTDLYILPGYAFRAVDAMVTNFHLPRSTLLMMVSAFGGRETILSAYETAIQEGYRFYSFGDAMLIL